jgi:hypothetical protein
MPSEVGGGTVGNRCAIGQVSGRHRDNTVNRTWKREHRDETPRQQSTPRSASRLRLPRQSDGCNAGERTPIMSPATRGRTRSLRGSQCNASSPGCHFAVPSLKPAQRAKAHQQFTGFLFPMLDSFISTRCRPRSASLSYTDRCNISAPLVTTILI